MRKLLPVYLITSLALLSLAFSTLQNKAEKSTVAVIQGYVYDAYFATGLEGVVVSILDYTTVTNQDGSYELILDVGNYDLYFTKPGWITGIIPGLAVADTLMIDISLQRHPHGFPFNEDWSSGSFETNFWTFEPEQDNWQISDTLGNPDQCVIFTLDPGNSGNFFELISHPINLIDVIQHAILEFDLMLGTNAKTDQGILRVDIWNGDEWIEIDIFASDTVMMWQTYRYNISQYVFGKISRLRFVVNTIEGNALNVVGIDNIRIIQAPEIIINPQILYFAMTMYTIYTKHFVIENIGVAPLDFELAVICDPVKKELGFQRKNQSETSDDLIAGPQVSKAAEIKVNTGLELNLANCIPGGDPNPPSLTEVILHYDGPNFEAIGLTAGGTFHVAARFPSSMMGQYVSYALESVDVYINDVPDNAILKIWGAGTGFAPGAILHQQTFTATPNSWITVMLTNPVILDGAGIWVGYEVTHAASNYPAGCDAGPANPNGDWISLDGVTWEHLAGYGLNYNWNIRAKLKAGCSYLTVEPSTGSIPGLSSQIISVTCSSHGLDSWSEYFAEVQIQSNDPISPLSILNVYVFTGTNSISNYEPDERIVCYPIPTSDFLHIEFSKEITNFRIISQIGQLILDHKTNGQSLFNLKIHHLPNGLYFLQAEAKDGRTYSRKIVISR